MNVLRFLFLLPALVLLSACESYEPPYEIVRRPLDLVERRHHKGARAIGTTVGVISGVMGGAYVADTAANGSAGAFVATWTGLATSSGVGGYMLGKQIETQTTSIKVVE